MVRLHVERQWEHLSDEFFITAMNNRAVHGSHVVELDPWKI